MAKFDMFNGKVDETPNSEKKLNTWYDDLSIPTPQTSPSLTATR